MDNLSEAQTIDVPQPPVVVGVTAHSQHHVIQHNTAHSPQPLQQQSTTTSTSSSHTMAQDRIVEVVAQEVGGSNRTEIVAEINNSEQPLHQSSDVSERNQTKIKDKGDGMVVKIEYFCFCCFD
jgi:hypothetical protein